MSNVAPLKQLLKVPESTGSLQCRVLKGNHSTNDQLPFALTCTHGVHWAFAPEPLTPLSSARAKWPEVVDD